MTKPIAPTAPNTHTYPFRCEYVFSGNRIRIRIQMHFDHLENDFRAIEANPYTYQTDRHCTPIPRKLVNNNRLNRPSGVNFSTILLVRVEDFCFLLVIFCRPIQIFYGLFSKNVNFLQQN